MQNLQMIRDVFMVVLILLLMVLIPGGVIYLGASFVFLDWEWFSNVDYEVRLASAGILFALWAAFSYFIVKGTTYVDDRMDPDKKCNEKKT